MEEKTQTFEARLEALLFVHGDPIALEKIARILSCDENDVENTLQKLHDRYLNPNYGFCIIRSGKSVQLATKPEFSAVFKDIIKEELNETLTPAALETLAIIAYAGPISRNIIDYIRGVNSSYILRNLMIRGLINRETDPKRPHSFIYSAAFDFLRQIGLARIEDLPDFSHFRGVVERIKSGANQ